MAVFIRISKMNASEFILWKIIAILVSVNVEKYYFKIISQ